MLVLVLFLQLFGFTGNCTQGADGPFITGAILSGPILLVAIAIAAWKVVRLRRQGDVPFASVTAVLPFAMCCYMMVETRNAWLGILPYDSPCGEEYEWSASAFTTGEMFIKASNLLLPVCLALVLLVHSYMILRPHDATIQGRA